MANITFEEAIEATNRLLTESDRLDPPTIREKITDLVATENGARGFFVTYLTSDLPFADAPTPETIVALETSGAIVGDLLVKNFIMSTAMEVYHRRNGDEENALGSERVKARTSELIHRLSSPEIADNLQKLRKTLENNMGEYAGFFDRWGYDDEQLRAIAAATETLLPNR